MHRVNSVYTYTFTPIISLGRHWNNVATKKSGGSCESFVADRSIFPFIFFFSFFFYSSLRRFVLQSRLEERETAVTLADDSYATV